MSAVDTIREQLREADQLMADMRRMLTEAFLVYAPRESRGKFEQFVDLVLRASHTRARLEQQLREARRLEDLATAPRS